MCIRDRPGGDPVIDETYHPHYALKVMKKPSLDGKANEKEWALAKWRAMDQLIIGEEPSSEDFQGKYKLLWDEDMIYILVEIQDDKFMDQHKDGLHKYWDDDCLEIFIDENYSGGNHQYNHTAFAYHVSLNDKVVDLGLDEKPHYYSDHLEISKSQTKQTMLWEIGLKVYGDRYYDQDKATSRIKLTEGKRMGFMMAYSDNDNSEKREHFVCDIFIDREDKNLAWKDAGIFGNIILK